LSNLKKIIRENLRKALKVKNKQMIGYHRYPFNFLRSYPDFIIIGSQKAASSSLHNYLALHSEIKSPPIKETQFFNMNYDRGMVYYKSIFPIKNKSQLTFESTPDYLSHPLAPKLCFEHLPNIKLIVTLRNPVDRAVSHFNFVKGYGGEEIEMTLKKALQLEDERIKWALNNIEDNRYYAAASLARYGYKRNGEYVKHLKEWLKYYPYDNFFFIDFDEIKSNINSALKSIHDFLGLSFEAMSTNMISNKTKSKEKIDFVTFQYLNEYYKEMNSELFDLIKKDLKW